MLILSRPPNDTFTFRTFFNLTSKIKKPNDSFYLWSAAIDPETDFGVILKDNRLEHQTEVLYREELFRNIKNDLVIIGIKDHLTSRPFNPLTHPCPNLVSYIKDMFNFYHNKTFIVFTSLENLDSYIDNKNAHLIPWGGDITNQSNLYPKLNPVTNKNFSSKTTYLSLNRNNRLNRTLVLGALFGLNLQNYGLISCMFKDSIDSINSKEFSSYFNNNYNELINVGILAASKFEYPICDDRKIYPNEDNNNYNNFLNKLENYYTDTFVEIIAETSFTESCFLVTEKTLNSIYGCNFPIFISSKGIVNFLRNMGLDMFDDIINHSYDTIDNPVERCVQAIQLNQQLLTDIDYTKKVWQDNKERFLNNVQFVKTRMYEFYQNRTQTQFNFVINTLVQRGIIDDDQLSK